ncbi:MAG: FxsA family protein [Streptosporangiales bacterium]|nr:FxsA family protein [Streptosporangiales bacterium]
MVATPGDDEVTMARRRPFPMFVALLALPILEIWLIFQVAGLIGGGVTVLVLIAEVALGMWIIRGQGRRAFRAMNEAVATGVMPDRDLIDAVTVLAGGVLLLTPGFITDVLALLLLIPVTRPLVRRAATAYLSRRIEVVAARAGAGPPFGPQFGGPQFGPPHGAGPHVGRDEPAADGPDLRSGPVIHGEIIDDEDPRNRPES